MIGFARDGRLKALAVLGFVGAVVGVVTSQSRISVVAAIGAVLAFALLSSRSRQRTASLSTVAVAASISYLALTAFINANDSGAFDRYRTISPDQIVNTGVLSRGSSVELIPRYLVDFPLGAGIGRTGPASSVATGGASSLDAETEFTYLIVEIGVLGMLALLTLTVRLLFATRRVLSRIEDARTRAMVAGLGAPLFSIMGLWFVTTVSATVPLAPYFWVTAGALAYWLSATSTLAGPTPQQGLHVHPAAEGDPR